MSRERVLIEPTSTTRAEREAIVERARRRGFRSFVLPESDRASPSAETNVVRAGDHLEVPGEGAPVAIVPVSSPEDLQAALARAPSNSLLAIEWKRDRVIPLENAIAARQGRFRLWSLVGSVREVPAALGALEHGADRVVVAVHRPEEIDELEGVVDAPALGGLAWTEAEVRSIRPVGVGDRVLVDTTSLLRPDEGLLVGSAAAFLFLVASEAVGSAFSRPRPFRVNAGAAHSYVLRPDGATRYLAELEPGDPVLVASATSLRSARVGRIKVERRPLVSVAVEDGGRERTVFLQEAETVRLVTAHDRVAVTALSPGTKVRGVSLPPARHLGTAVEETIDER